MRLHADAVAENRSAAEGTGGIDRHNANGLALLAILARNLIHQRALACSRRARETDEPRFAAIGKERLQQLRRFGPPVFNNGDGTGQSAKVSRADTIHEFLYGFARAQVDPFAFGGCSRNQQTNPSGPAARSPNVESRWCLLR